MNRTEQIKYDLRRLGLRLDEMGLLTSVNGLVYIRDHDGDGKTITVSCEERKSRRYEANTPVPKIVLSICGLLLDY